MRAIGLLMITTILLALAGCAGTDGEVTVDLSTEELQEIIDDNKDDFLNNTTVVVFQEYYNNTTTNIDLSGGTCKQAHTIIMAQILMKKDVHCTVELKKKSEILLICN